VTLSLRAATQQVRGKTVSRRLAHDRDVSRINHTKMADDSADDDDPLEQQFQQAGLDYLKSKIEEHRTKQIKRRVSARKNFEYTDQLKEEMNQKVHEARDAHFKKKKDAEVAQVMNQLQPHLAAPQYPAPGPPPKAPPKPKPAAVPEQMQDNSRPQITTERTPLRRMAVQAKEGQELPGKEMAALAPRAQRQQQQPVEEEEEQEYYEEQAPQAVPKYASKYLYPKAPNVEGKKRKHRRDDSDSSESSESSESEDDRRSRRRSRKKGRRSSGRKSRRNEDDSEPSEDERRPQHPVPVHTPEPALRQLQQQFRPVTQNRLTVFRTQPPPVVPRKLKFI